MTKVHQLTVCDGRVATDTVLLMFDPDQGVELIRLLAAALVDAA